MDAGAPALISLNIYTIFSMQGKRQLTQGTMEFHHPHPEIFRLHQFLARVGLKGYISIKLTDQLIQKNN